MNITDKYCTGCCACMNICSNNAIKMEHNDIGELTPFINYDLCTNCNLCSKMCPQNNLIKKNSSFDCYAVWSKESSIRKQAASGGFASGIANYFLNNKQYIVYYCDYDDDLELRYFEVKSLSDINKLAGSKYSQVNAEYTYTKIKNQLNNNINVIFISLPCQIAGLLAYLKKNYTNLITIDIVCHGTPPNKYLKEYVKYLCGTNIKCKVEFKKKYKQFFTLYKNNKLLYKKHHSKDIYFTAFYQNIISRNSCYTCQYATDKRVGDLTIGDFWGLGEIKTIKKPSKWVSLVLINTDKGMIFFDTIKNAFIIEKRTVEEAVRGNGRLQKAPGKSQNAINFQKSYNIYGFIDSIKKIEMKKVPRYNFIFFKRIKNYAISFLLEIRNYLRRLSK